VEMPQQSLKAQQLAQATERYFALLQNQDAADSDELVTAEADYRQALEPFSDDPGLTAFLKLEAMAKAKEKEAEVDRGLAPRSYQQYEDAIEDLTAQLGKYCSYCERYISIGLAVEHVSKACIHI
jgi:hypothetical protein